MGKPKVSLGCLIVAIVCVAVACGAGAYLYRCRMTWNIVPPSRWPSELQTLIADLRHEGVDAKGVEVRSVGLGYTGSINGSRNVAALTVNRTPRVLDRMAR